MKEPTGSRAGNRQRLPEDALKVCASCQRVRGSRRTGWEPITHGQHVVGWTCPECPRHDEPIRREVRGERVRFVAVVRDVNRRQVKARRDSLAEARGWVAERRAEVEAGREVERGSGETVAQLCDRWLVSRADVRAVTVESYRYALAPALRHIGDRKAATVTAADVQRLVAWLSASGGKSSKAHPVGRPLGPRAVRLALIGLAQAFDLADLPVNPVRHKSVRRPRKVERVGADLEHWQPDAVIRFRDHADTDPLAAAWRLTLCGLTRADVLGLRWSDVDLDAGTVTVRRGRVAVLGGRESVTDEPKSPQRRRTVPVEVIHPGTVALLRALRARQAQSRLIAGAAWHDSGLVVVDELGRGPRPEVYSDRFRRLCRAAGVPVIRLHSVRHSLAFWLHSLGVTPADAAALLGHTVEVHLSTYLPESGNAGVARAAAALGQVTARAVAE
ncbi:tyrosine-type recombinase/integrase [Intrasporangium sp. DVR]|uniref:site-specific integrase n=1 Tax=Intrasporangium sp. DVR TaxID=3127867 RepID=UPI00313A6348